MTLEDLDTSSFSALKDPESLAEMGQNSRLVSIQEKFTDVFSEGSGTKKFFGSLTIEEHILIVIAR